MLHKKIIDVDIDLIATNPEQPRKIFNEEDLVSLSNSIKEYGVLQPIILNKKKDGKYYLIAGERRYRASKLIGMKKIPAIIKDSTEQDVALIALVENVQREGLSYIEEARAYKKLMIDFNLTQEQVASYVGKKQSTVSNKMRLLVLPESIQEVLLENKLTERHARALLKVKDDDLRKNIIEKIIKNDLNVRQSEKLINDLLEKEGKISQEKRRKSYLSYRIYINSFRKVYNEIKNIKKDILMEENDRGEYIELTIKLPKENHVSHETLLKNA